MQLTIVYVVNIFFEPGSGISMKLFLRRTLVRSELSSSLRGLRSNLLLCGLRGIYVMPGDCFVPRNDARCYTVQVCDARKAKFIFISLEHKIKK